MEAFSQGEKVEKTFFIEQENDDGTKEPVAISDVVGVLYEEKTGREIARVEPTAIDEYNVLFVFTPEITRKCQANVELMLDIWVGNIQKIYFGAFGSARKSPVSNEN